MKNLFIILAVLGIIFVIVLALFISQVKTADFSGLSVWFNKFNSSSKSNANLNENLNTAGEKNTNEYTGNDESVEDVGDLNFFTLELGRREADIQSKRTYTFYLPVDIVYELQGVDASSSILLFKKDGQEIFKMTNFDYAKSEDDIDKYWPDADEYTLKGGHTNIVELLNDDYEDEMYIFVDTLKIDDQPAF